MAKVIQHPELNAEAEVQDESVSGWLEVGWVLKDDKNVPSDDASPVAEES